MRARKGRIIRILQICGYRFGAAGHHHVAKESKGNKAYRLKYLRRMLRGRDANGMPIQPEIYYDESYVRAPNKLIFLRLIFLCSVI